MDWFVRPLARQSKLSPRPQVLLWPACYGRIPLRTLPSATAFRPEDPIQLIHGQPMQWVVLVHEEDRRRRIPLLQIERARRKHHLLRVISPHTLQRLQVGVPRIVPHHIDVRRIRRQPRKPRGQHQVIEPRQRMLLQKPVLPQVNQMLRQLRPMNANHPMQMLRIIVAVILRQRQQPLRIDPGQLRRSLDHGSRRHLQPSRRSLRSRSLRPTRRRPTAAQQHRRNHAPTLATDHAWPLTNTP